jgi:catalase
MPDAHPSVTIPLIAPVKYVPALEHPEENEAAVDAEIVETLQKISETTLANGKHALRSVHAKSHGLLIGELTIHEHLPESLAQGLFATPGSYPVVMRLSTTPGDILEDSVSTPRGLAIKVIGTNGPRVAGSEADVTQDFVLVNGPAFMAPNAKGFLKSLKLLEPTTDKMESVKKLTSAVARGAEAVVEAVGGKSATLTSLGGHPETHILGETFYSQVPILYGAYIAKIAVVPTSPGLTELTNKPLTNNGEPNMLRNLVVDFFLKNAATWDIRAQLCTNLETMPIEDASIPWPETESPYITVGEIKVGPQDTWHIEKIEAIDERLSFSPWHALAAHRPLGSVMRARKSAYEKSAQFRAEHNHKTIAEPKLIGDLQG